MDDLLGGQAVRVRSTSRPAAVAGYLVFLRRQNAGLKGVYLHATGHKAVGRSLTALMLLNRTLQKREGCRERIFGVPVYAAPLASTNEMFMPLLEHRPAVPEAVGSNVFELVVLDTTDASKLSGAIAGAIRAGRPVTLVPSGARGPLIATKAIHLARQFVRDRFERLGASPLHAEEGEGVAPEPIALRVLTFEY